jgi:hypothetical protein
MVEVRAAWTVVEGGAWTVVEGGIRFAGLARAVLVMVTRKS